LIRESIALCGYSAAFHEVTAPLDRQVLAVVLQCHRGFGRCNAVLKEIIAAPAKKYFPSEEIQRKSYRRTLRSAFELREIVLACYRGRNEVLRTAMSRTAYRALRSALEERETSQVNDATGQPPSTEDRLVAFLESAWVTGFHDTVESGEVVIPEMVAFRGSSGEGRSLGRTAIEDLEGESKAILEEFRNYLNVPFESYCEEQRRWTDTDAVRELEYDGDNAVKRLATNYCQDLDASDRTTALRITAANNRWMKVEMNVIEPWMIHEHWMMAKHTDRLHRRILMERNRDFDSHEEASYELMLGREREREEKARLQRLEKKRLQEESMRFDGTDGFDDSADFTHKSSMLIKNAREGIIRLGSERELFEDEDDAEKEEDDIEGSDEEKDDKPQEEEKEKDSDELGWARAFVWASDETVVTLFEDVVMVTLRHTTKGQLLLTTHSLFFNPSEDAINVMTKKSATEHIRHPTRWMLSRLSEVHGRRYMLRQQALELFFADSFELFLNFSMGPKERERFYSKLRRHCIAPMLRSPKSLNPRAVYKKSKFTEMWRKRKISNFQYLMQLNIMAGRSFNDITQYPVFPWVLGDYESETLDLKNPKHYRDLSKPIGALNPDRLEQLIERYNNLDGFPEEEKFLYGSHYSSPGAVLHYLVRQEPFTSMAIELQSGRFDCPDRLFFDLSASWNSCMTSTSDVKELIPEFFTCPEIFSNTNKFPLGRTQSKILVDDVGLPPWAKGSAHEFVRMHRQALESEYVSRHLNHWVDLVFGFKQRGAAAAAANNIFHYLSYEGTVDLDKITDEVDRAATESHIQNFGQTPSQLILDEPHPSRSHPDVCWKPLCNEITHLQQLRCNTPSRQFGGNASIENKARGAVLSMHVMTDSIVAVYSDLSVGTYRFSPSRSGTNPFTFRMDRIRTLGCTDTSTSPHAALGVTSFPEAVLQKMRDEHEKGRLAIGSWSFCLTLGGSITDSIRNTQQKDISVSSYEPHSLLLSCGYWDNTVKVHSLDGLRFKFSSSGGHRGPINCMKVGGDGALMVTGGQDATCRVWAVDHHDMALAVSDGYVQTAMGSSVTAKDRTLICCHVLWGHEGPITCVDLSSDLDVAISGSTTGMICVHSIRQGKFIRTISAMDEEELEFEEDYEYSVPVRLVTLDSSGVFVVHMENGMLCSYTINGVRLCETDARERLNALKFCSGGEMLVTGGERSTLVVRSITELSVLCVLDLSKHGPIRSISFTPEELNPLPQFMFIGSEDGMITVVDKDPSLNPKRDARKERPKPKTAVSAQFLKRMTSVRLT